MATTANIYMDQGTVFSAELIIIDDTGVPVDISNATFEAQVRKFSKSPVAFVIDCGIIDGPSGSVELFVEPYVTANTTPDKYVYDVVMTTEDNLRVKVLEGLLYLAETISSIDDATPPLLETLVNQSGITLQAMLDGVEASANEVEADRVQSANSALFVAATANTVQALATQTATYADAAALSAATSLAAASAAEIFVSRIDLGALDAAVIATANDVLETGAFADAAEASANSAAIFASSALTFAASAAVSANAAAASAASINLGALEAAVATVQSVRYPAAWYDLPSTSNTSWFDPIIGKTSSIWLDAPLVGERPAIAATHAPASWPQLAVTIPALSESDTTYTRPVLWSSRTPSSTAPISRKTHRYVETVDIFGNPALLDVSLAQTDQTANTNVRDILIYMGQSLSVEESGPGADSLRSWPAYLEYPIAAPSDRLFTLRSTIQNTNGNPPYYMSTGPLSSAKDNFPGGIDPTTGLRYSSTRGRLLGAISYLEGYLSPIDGRSLVVGGLSRGGKSIKYFLPSTAGGISESGIYFWDAAITPYLDRMAVLAAEAGVTIGRVSVIWTHHEYEHGSGATKAEYRADLDALCSELKSAVASRIGADVAFYMVSTHGARIYETTHDSIPAGSAIGEVSQTIVALFEKGISSDVADAEFVCSPPNYDLSWSGSISHLVGEAQGYVQLFARGVYTLMQAIRAREAGQPKPKPSGPDWAAGYWSVNNTVYRVPTTVRNGDGSWALDSRGDATRFDGIPPKPNDGFSFYGDLPAIQSISFDEVAFEFVSTFATAYTGSTGKIAVAYAVPDALQFMGCWQGWRTLSQDPTKDDWIHRGIGANWRISQGEVCPLTGRDLYHYPHPYIAAVAAPI